MTSAKQSSPSSRLSPANPSPGGGGFALAHLSDPHLSNPQGVALSQLLNKRILGYLSWRLRRRLEHQTDVLGALVADLERMRPDHVVITGDLTHLGLPHEFGQVAAWLNGLSCAQQLTLVPGNHDTYVRERRESTLALWEPYMRSDGCGLTGSSSGEEMFPSLRVRGPLALVGVTSAIPSAPFLAVGTLGPSQLDRLASVLESLGREGLFRVLVLHHPPTRDTVGWRKRLTDGEALRTLLARVGVELVVHGHSHRAEQGWVKTPVGRAPVIGVPSASAIGHRPGRRARYHIYRLTQGSEGWRLQVSVRGYQPGGGCFAAEGERLLSDSG